MHFISEDLISLCDSIAGIRQIYDFYVFSEKLLGILKSPYIMALHKENKTIVDNSNASSVLNGIKRKKNVISHNN